MLKTPRSPRLLALAAAVLILLGLLGFFLVQGAAAPLVTPSPATLAPPTPTRPPAAPSPAEAASPTPVPATATAPATATPPAATPTPIPPSPPATPMPPPPTVTAAPRSAPAPPTSGSRSPIPDPRSPTLPSGTATPLPVETPDPAAWRVRHTAHYDLLYLPNSPAAHDIDTLATMAEDALRVAAANLQTAPDVRIRIYFANRIFWQGGASYSHNELLISYPPAGRDYTSTSLVLVLRHETTHALVEQLLGSPAHKGGLLGEGVAVWSAGGHYQPEAVATLASTLVGPNSDLYIPLSNLRQDFYGAQHELAYIEGAAYVKFLIDRWGLAKFKRYLDQPDDPQPIYGLDSAVLESAWRTWLGAAPAPPATATAVRLRVRYYDLMRRYEATLDPGARLLPDAPPSQWGPTLVRLFGHPAAAPANLRAEQRFVQAGSALWSGDLATCARLLDTLSAAIP